jgi:hypothetical protein
VQTNVHSLEAVHSGNQFIFNNLPQGQAGLSRMILFLEGQIQLFKTQKFLELNAEPASKRPERRYQDNMAVPATGGDVSLRQ